MKSYDDRIRRLEKRRRLSTGINPITEALKHLPLETLEQVLRKGKPVTREQAERIHELAILMQQNPRGEVPKEFWDLDVVRQVMDKEESLE